MALTDQGKCATGMMKKLGSRGQLVFHCLVLLDERRTCLFESSAIPAKALYQAKNAASSAKKPPAFMMGGLGRPAELRCR